MALDLQVYKDSAETTKVVRLRLYRKDKNHIELRAVDSTGQIERAGQLLVFSNTDIYTGLPG